MKTLVVEDVCMMRKLLEKLLTPFGKCDTVENGREALIKFNQAWLSGEKYDVVFLDLMIPEISGEIVLKEMRTVENNMGVEVKDNVKIIVCSALNDSENVLNVVNKQCDAYITKPFDRHLLYDTLKKLNLISSKEIKKVIAKTQKSAESS